MKVGFIGAGNMGGALLRAVGKTADEILVYDKDEKKAEAFLTKNVRLSTPDEMIRACDFVFLGVKPNVIGAVLKEICGKVADTCTLISMAAGIDLETVTGGAKTDRVVRIMPNTPVGVGEGTVLYCKASGVDEKTEEDFLGMLKNAGKVDPIPEKLIDAAAALSGCGPAFVCMFAEALADGAVRCGLPRDKALLYAEQTILGTAKMMLASEKHPEELKDAVCSPGGTTIEGVLALEEGGFRAASANAVIKAYEKTAALKK